MKDKGFLFFSLPLVMLLIIQSCCGLYIESIYAQETEIYKIQALAQDVVNLYFISPLILLSGYFSYKKRKVWKSIWLGCMIYLVYSFCIYAFALHFNSLFLVYCIILGLSFYALVYSLIFDFKESSPTMPIRSMTMKSTSIFLAFVAILFYFVWLSEIIPALINGSTPYSIIESGLLSNPVHVLDISFVLPMFLIITWLLIKKKSLGLILAGPALIFIVLMAIAIMAMIIMAGNTEMSGDTSMAFIFAIISVISILHFIFLEKSNSNTQS